MPDFSLPALAHGSAIPDYRLHDARLSFRLIYGATELVIQEPAQYDASEWVLERDRKYHGFDFEYTGDETPLTFYEKAAVTFIESAYAADGPDAEIIFVWGFTFGADVLEGSRLRLLLSKRALTAGVLTVPAERAGVHFDLRGKWGTTIAMDAVKTLDGADITPPTPKQLLLHAQTIAQQTKWAIKEKQDTGWLPILNTTSDYKVFYLSMPLQEPDPDEISSENKGSINGVGIEYPPGISRTVLKPRDPGRYVFDIDLDFVFDLRMMKRTISINPPDIDDWTFDMFLIIGSEKIRIGVAQTGNKRSRFLDGMRFIGKATITKTLPADTPVYLFGSFQIYPKRSSWKGTEVRLVTSKCTVSVKASTTAAATAVPAYMTIDALKHLYSSLTGRVNAIQSAYYSLQSEEQPADGGGSRRLLLNGFMARGFVPAKPLQLSMEELLQSLQAIDSIGFAIKPTDDGDVAVVEPASFFYRNNEVMAISKYTVIEEETDATVLHGKVNVGYKKFPEEGPQVLDEFATRHEYNTPLRSESTYEAVSGLIASGYALELTRREQFSEKPADSTKYDDDCFIICSLPPTETNHVATIGGSFSFSFTGGANLTINGLFPEWLVSGVEFTVSGSLYNNRTYRVKSVVALRPNPGPGGTVVPRYQVSLSMAIIVLPESGFFTLTASGVSGGLWQAERAEAFDQVENLTDPQTTYNLRLSPRFNLLRHAPLLAGGLMYKDGSKLLTLQFAKQNAGLITRLADSAEGENNINVRKRIQHNDPLNVADMRAPAAPLWRPETVTISARLSIDQMLYLKACYQGTHPDPTKHLGYLTLAGNEAAGIDARYGWPLLINYNTASQEARIKLRLLYSPKGGTPPEGGCADYAQYTFGDFENLPPGELPLWIYNCLFGVFD